MNASPTKLYEYAGAGQRRYTGVIFVVLLHVLIVYGLVSGLARKAVEIVKKPIEMKILEEIKLLPPPPPPPPKLVKVPDLPPLQQTPPPPPFVPPPEVQLPPPQVAVPTIQAIAQEPPLSPVEIKPPPPPAPPAPPAAPPAPPALRAEIGLACPGYKEILASSLAGQYDRVGISGTVRVMIKIRGKQIVDVTPVSGPREYYRAVQGALRRLNCIASGDAELVVPLEVSFREE